MQEPLPYKRWEALPPMASASPATTTSGSGGGIGDGGSMSVMNTLVKENPVIVLGRRGCCMCHVVRKLLLGLGVNPPVFEIDGDATEAILVNSLSKIDENVKKNLQFPVVFIGGELFGGLDKVMATHLSGELVPILKKAGALWL